MPVIQNEEPVGKVNKLQKVAPLLYGGDQKNSVLR